MNVRLDPRPGAAMTRLRLRLPIRFKLAAVSAALTFAILLVFALVVGGFTERKLRSSADSELRATAADLQSLLQGGGIGVSYDTVTGQPRLSVNDEIFRLAAAGDAVVRIFNYSTGEVHQRTGAPDLGKPFEGFRDVGRYRVVTRPLLINGLGAINGFDPATRPIDGAIAAVQYAKPRDALESTIARVRLFLLLGVAIGTVLAFVAGFAVARRAMRPISGLTKAAREVARTRDPARTPLPRPEADDEVAELATTLTDMLQELDAARTETEGALQRQREFVADASHELRTPLTSILANLELLEERLGRQTGDHEASELAASALRSSRRMRRLVGDLLLLARADAGRPARREPIDLVGVVRGVADEATALAAGHPLTLDLPADPIHVSGSADDLHRMALNLVENAFLHTPSGTPVHVSLELVDGAAQLCVADRGPGIPHAEREHIFERFARRHGDSSVAGGSGLGLAIVRAVVLAHGGTVLVRAAESGGSLFVVTLPTAPLRSPGGRVDGLVHGQTEPQGAKPA